MFTVAEINKINLVKLRLQRWRPSSLCSDKKPKHSFEWLVLNWNVKLTYRHGKAEWFEARKSTQKRNNHLNPTFFVPRLTEEKERDEEFAQQLDKLLLMLLCFHTQCWFSCSLKVSTTFSVLTSSMLTFSVLTFAVLTFSVSKDVGWLKGLSKSDDWRANASSVDKQQHLHSAHEL